MVSFFIKKFEELDYSDIESLVSEGVPESHSLDYKEDYPRKLSKVLTSFANATGGYIVLGIKEEKINGKNTGRPKEILGIKREDHETRITNILISNSQPIIIPKVLAIKVPSSEKDVVIIKIKESYEPIMETYTYRFYIRINDQSLPADYSIVKKLFNNEIYQTEKRIQKIFNFIKDLFKKMTIMSKQKHGVYIAYEICLDGLDCKTEEANDQTQREIFEFGNIMLVFKDDLKYFGSNEDLPLSFYFGRYIIKQNRFLECLAQFAPPDSQRLFPQILSDLKKYCKKYFAIDLN